MTAYSRPAHEARARPRTVSQGGPPTPASSVTLAEFAARWPRRHAIRPTTCAVYDVWLSRVWCPAVGARPLADLTRADVLAVLDAERARGLKPGTLRSLLAILRALLTDAQDEGLVVANVAQRLGRLIGRSEPRAAPMNRAELGYFLEATAAVLPAQLPLFLTLARSGVRIGEAIALGPGDADLAGRQLRVEKTIRRDGTIGPTKTRHSRRRVDMSQQLCLALEPLVRTGQPFLFGGRHGPLRYEQARYAFGRIREAASLRAGLSLHSFRHSYASLLLASGVSPAFVQRQLGHASIQLTLDLYGRHMPYRDLAAVDRLDDTAA